MKKLILILIVLIIASGCYSNFIYLNTSLTPEKSSKKSYLYIKSYEIGVEKIAYIGQSMVKWRPAKQIVTTNSDKPYMRVDNDFSLIGKYGTNEFMSENIVVNGLKGDEFKVEGVTNIGITNYYIMSTNTNPRLLIDSNGRLNKDIILGPSLAKGYMAVESTLSPPDAHFSYFVKHPKEDNKVDITPFGISRELIFGGVNNVSINVTYREYTPDDMARQAFTQNLIYQTTAQTIRFQDMKIEVHEVTNEKIVFTVLEDGLGLPTP